MTARALLALSLALAASCGPGAETAAPAPGPQFGPVVSETLARLEAELAALEEPAPAAPDDVEERLAGLLETAANPRDSMSTLALDELAGLGDAISTRLAARLVDRDAPAAQRSAAAAVLARIDSPAAAEALLGVLVGARAEQEPEPWLYARCAWQLGKTSQDWVAPRLALCLKYEKDHETVVWLADTLARFGLLSGLEGLFAVQAGAPDPELRAQAEAVLERLREELGCEDWTELDRLWREGPLERLPEVARGPRYRLEVWRQIAALGEWQLRWVDDGRFLLAHLREDAAGMLAQALGDESVYVRLHAAQCLERMGSRAIAAGEALLALTDDPRVGDQAVSALGALGHAPAREVVRAGLAPEHPLGRRVACARALLGLAPEDLLAALTPLLAESEPIDLRVAAAASLVRSAHTPGSDLSPAVAILREALTSGEVAPREAETALEVWLERWSSSVPEGHPEGTKTLEAWRAVPPEPVRERLAARAELLRAAPGELED